jgi:phosphohistidine swiveling domain-containing protein
MSKSVSVYLCPDGTQFPVEWPDPADAWYGWRWDQMHVPLPLTPLSDAFTDDVGEGFNRVLDSTGAPQYGVRLTVHGYRYMRQEPFDDDPAVRAAVHRRDTERRMDRVLALWHAEYRPEAEALTRALRTLDGAEPSLRALVDRLDQVHAARRRHGELHHLTMQPATQAANRFIDFCLAEFGADGEAIAGDLMGGFRNKSLESAEALWALALAARERPAVADLLPTAGPAEFLRDAPSVRGGADFLRLLTAYLDEYGHRNESFSELSFPTWREDPRFPLFLLRRYLDTPDDGSPTAMHAAVVRRREERLREVEPRLGAEPGKLATFRARLASAQQRTILLEDHNFFIDQQGTVAVRVPLLAIGRRLAEQGTIAGADDVFYLVEDEIRRAAIKPHLRLAGVVAERRAERERWLRVLPPAVIGAGAVPPNPMLDRFFGALISEPEAAGDVRGIAGSPGVFRGTARVVLTLADVDRLAPGEILVTHATAPPWTPLFAVAGAVVTDMGGTLSHCAVVAREYGIPAVVGARQATARIPDGAVITVDGTRGIVRVEEG